MADFRIWPLRISFAPSGGGLRIAEGKGSDFMRRILGRTLEELGSHGDGDCAEVFQAVYGRAEEGGPSGFRDPVRPIVIRAEGLDGVRFVDGQRVSFSIYNFAAELPVEGAVRRAFAVLGGAGIGEERRKLADVVVKAEEERRVRLDARAGVRRIRVRFLTPTELKSGGAVLQHPEFPVLFARARDRVSRLQEAFQGGGLQVDYQRLGDLSLDVECARADVADGRRIRAHNGETGRSYDLGGFTGEAEFAGVLDELVPFLEVCEWTGVGRQTVWGHGALQVSIPSGV